MGKLFPVNKVNYLIVLNKFANGFMYGGSVW